MATSKSSSEETSRQVDELYNTNKANNDESKRINKEMKKEISNLKAKNEEMRRQLSELDSSKKDKPEEQPIIPDLRAIMREELDKAKKEDSHIAANTKELYKDVVDKGAIPKVNHKPANEDNKNVKINNKISAIEKL